MRRMRLRAIAALAIGGWLVGLAVLDVPVRAADRPADLILAELDSVEVPKLDPSQKGETAAMLEYLNKRKAAMARRGELILELFRGHPEHPRLLALFDERWQDQLRSATNAAPDPRFTAELDEVMSRTKNEKLKADAAFFKTLVAVETAQGGPEDILKAVEQFIRLAPRDERGAMLLYSLADQMPGSPLQADLFKRVISSYPESRFANLSRVALKKQESVGKPFELEFTDAISGSPVAMKDLRGKVVVVDFWATWCGPCVAEMPKMKELYARYRGQGVEFIGVSLDRSREEGGLDTLKEFVAKNQITWPQYYQGNYWESEFSASWGIDAIPAVFVVDQDGKLASIDARGRLDEIIPELLRKRGPESGGR